MISPWIPNITKNTTKNNSAQTKFVCKIYEESKLDFFHIFIEYPTLELNNYDFLTSKL